MDHSVADWPGKADDSGRTHPAAFHMLDVAACFERVAESLGAVRMWSEPLRQAVQFLVALHDLGKVSDAFRRQIVEGRPPHPGCRHAELTFQLLRDLDEPFLAGVLGGGRQARRELYAAVAGHHGGPIDPGDAVLEQRRRDAIGVEAARAASGLAEQLHALFPGAALGAMRHGEARRLSWLVSGLTVIADWIGSNDIWFPFAAPDDDLTSYRARAQAQAEIAVSAAGLGRAEPRLTDPRTLLDLPGLRPMQAATAEAPLPDGPVMGLIEDATGAGKTEAALILAQRMMQAGKGGGLYFALPTMATANAMFARLRPILGRMFDGRPSLALAHGRSALSDDFAEVLGNDGARAQDAGCAAWLADDRRRALLADIGVGTVDQALMAVLPTRFHTLRLAALSGRILIVDEAHAYDPYMKGQLETLLRFQAMLGGSAIVMTATLPTPMRRAYARAFLKGAGSDTAPSESADYPALTVLGGETAHRAVAPVPATVRRVAVSRLPTAENAVETLAAGARAGAACVWVRNAVDDAIAAVKALRAAGVAADLFHARFAMCDRLAVEQRQLERFGKAGAGRRGSVLVATQVVEASLDLDFDVMVSDLAPVGALIQRAGRLWRHMDLRPADARPVPGPHLHVVSPDPADVTDAHWLHGVLEAGAWVYATDAQWRTADGLFRAGEIAAPNGLRALIEAVHGEEIGPLPAPLEQASREAEGTRYADAALAHTNTVSPVRGYGDTADTVDDQRFPTRLGTEQVTLILTRRGANGLECWARADSRARAEALSEVQISRSRYEALPERPAQDTDEIAEFIRPWKAWRKKLMEAGALAVAVVGEGGHICEGLRYDAEMGLLAERRGAR